MVIRLSVLVGCLVAGLVAGLLGNALHAPSASSIVASWVPGSPQDSQPVTPEDSEPVAPEDSQPVTPEDSEPVTPDESAQSRPTLASPADPTSVRLSGASLFGWTLIDRRTSRTVGSKNAATAANTVESMIKPWIAADFLRRFAESNKEPSAQTLDELTFMIVDSHDPMAEKYYRLGGSDAVVQRLITRCQLTGVSIKPTLWSWTLMTPQDAARYGLCLADGRAAGPQWTSWILDTMRHVRGGVHDQGDDVGGGRWGIIDGLPAQLARDTSIKNGWTLYQDGWHVSCLAVHPDWVLAVMIRTGRGLPAAADGCRSVAARLVVDSSG